MHFVVSCLGRVVALTVELFVSLSIASCFEGVQNLKGVETMTFEEKRERAGLFREVTAAIVREMEGKGFLRMGSFSYTEFNACILNTLVTDGPALAEVPASRSWDGETIVREMGIGCYVLLLNQEDAKLRLTKNGEGSGRPLELPVSLAEAEKLVRGDSKSQYYVGALTQFRNRNRLGWREVVGDIGEKYDVYTLVQ